MGSGEMPDSRLTSPTASRLPSFSSFAAARLLKLGKRLAVGEVNLLSGSSPDPIAHVTATYSIPNK